MTGKLIDYFLSWKHNFTTHLMTQVMMIHRHNTMVRTRKHATVQIAQQVMMTMKATMFTNLLTKAEVKTTQVEALFFLEVKFVFILVVSICQCVYKSHFHSGVFFNFICNFFCEEGKCIFAHFMGCIIP